MKTEMEMDIDMERRGDGDEDGNGDGNGDEGGNLISGAAIGDCPLALLRAPPRPKWDDWLRLMM